jgi:RNA polymerase sigma factor (sigma-70 family)
LTKIIIDLVRFLHRRGAKDDERMLTDTDLLRRYAQDGSEAAFGELVARHVNLVYSTALRILNGDKHLACDVAQGVFTDLAWKSKQLCEREDKGSNPETAACVSISGWLYTSTRFAAAKAVRAEQTRRKHEQKAHAMKELLHIAPVEPDWAQLRPVIDDAMGVLDETDRGALLLRFFEDQDLRTVGCALGLSEDAARMRISRALDKLRELLAKRGVTTTAGALSVTLAAKVVEAAPVGLAATITGASLSAVAVTTTPSIGLFMASVKSKIALTALLAVGIASPLIMQRTSMNRLRVENENLRAQLSAAQAMQLTPQTNAPDSTEPTRTGSQETELLRLRGEVTRLRADAARQQPNAQAKARPRSEPLDTIGGYEMYTGDLLGPHHADTIKMMKMVGMALRRLEQDSAISADMRAMPFSQENELRAELKKSISLPNEEWNQFEILVPTLDTLTENKSDSGLIVARSKYPIQTPDGRWVRVYLRVDGSVVNLIHDSATKALDFGELENSTRSNSP